MTKWLLGASVFLSILSAQAAQAPDQVFDRACSACHAGQLPTAPKEGDRAAWAPRLAQGMDTLLLHVVQGYKAMPPRGLCMDCSAEDYEAVIRWMSGSEVSVPISHP